LPTCPLRRRTARACCGPRPSVIGHGCSPPRPPTPILPRFLLAGIAPFRLRLAVELPAWHMVNAALARVCREVAFDGVSRGAGPAVLGRHARASLFGGLLRLLRLRLRLSWRTCQTILAIGTGRTVPGVSADVAPGVRRATVPAMAARAMRMSIQKSGSKKDDSH